MHLLLRFFKDWMLPIAMVLGALAYFVARRIPVMAANSELVLDIISVVQPVLIFAMLFISFCKVNPNELRLRRWHGWLLLIQVCCFALLSLLLICIPSLPGSVVVEGAMICLICPTATAALVVTNKLGGDTAGVTTYTTLINLVVAIVVPALVPLVHPNPNQTFLSSFFLIMGQVFPMLICPLFAAMLVRWLFPKFHKIILTCKDLAFYIWSVSLSIAIAVTVHNMANSEESFVYEIGLGVVSLLSCIFQFAVGHQLGKRYGCPISAGQSLGQKNTILIIWMGYTFFTPVSSVAGGFYSVWHNVYNSWQLYQKRKADEGNT